MITKKFFRVFVLCLYALILLISCSPVIQENLDCEQPLDDEIIDQLRLSLGTSLEENELQPGDTHQIELGYTECCYIFREVNACAAWSVEPESLATIDPLTGLLTVREDAPHDSIITVNADVENGRRIISQEVIIYIPEENPLVGIWREKAQLSCDSGEEVVPPELIGELQFSADGRFSVTWQPFEVYKDYWGDYTYDRETETIELVIDRGNNIPDQVDGSGTFHFGPNGELILDDIWLGEPVFEELPTNCGHIFELAAQPSR